MLLLVELLDTRGRSIIVAFHSIIARQGSPSTSTISLTWAGLRILKPGLLPASCRASRSSGAALIQLFRFVLAVLGETAGKYIWASSPKP